MTAISGHAQVPLTVCGELGRSGYDVLLTTGRAQAAGDALVVAGEGVRVALLCNPTPEGLTGGLNALRFLRHVFQLRGVLRRCKGAIAHFFGMKRVGLLAGALALSRCGARIVYTPVHYGTPFRSRGLARLERMLLGRIDCVLPTSQYVARLLSDIGVRSHGILRPGVLKDHGDDVRWAAEHPAVARRVVLFWRDATRQNGVDTAAEVFRRLAPSYRDLDFVFAVRFSDEAARDMEAVAGEHANVHVYRFPYPEGVTLIGLLRRASCALLPMRELSVQPQFSILETMSAGVPVVTTRIESNTELVESGVTGLLFDPEDTDEATACVRMLIDDREHARGISERAQDSVRARYDYAQLTARLELVYAELRRGSRPRGRPPQP